jgi:hypothetical protein
MAGIENSWQEGELGYCAFLLRCWQERDLENGGEPDESFVWRFALVKLNGRSSKKGFACLEDLFDYLYSQLNLAGELAKNQGVRPAVGSKLSQLEISKRREENES